jgi:hypothetical protein
VVEETFRSGQAGIKTGHTEDVQNYGDIGGGRGKKTTHRAPRDVIPDLGENGGCGMCCQAEREHHRESADE